jgi:hypothetical protein
MNTLIARVEKELGCSVSVVEPTDVGTPFFIHPISGLPVFLSSRQGPPVTSEEVRECLKDFP